MNGRMRRNTQGITNFRAFRLTVAVQANLPPEAYEHFERQKDLAEKEQQDILTGFNGVALHIKGHGCAGYRILADGGPMGAQWAFKRPNPKDPWGIRVIFGSAFLATLGLGAARAHPDIVLERLGIRTRPEDISISRLDYCVDILAPPDFVLDPVAFIMHASTNRRDHIANTDMAVSGKSGRTTSVTIGSVRARQVIVYDKRAEVIQTHKPHCWHIWNQTQRANGRPLIGPETPDLQIWRVGYRAARTFSRTARAGAIIRSGKSRRVKSTRTCSRCTKALIPTRSKRCSAGTISGCCSRTSRPAPSPLRRSKGSRTRTLSDSFTTLQRGSPIRPTRRNSCGTRATVTPLSPRRTAMRRPIGDSEQARCETPFPS
jgi:hypothetical protein